MGMAAGVPSLLSAADRPRPNIIVILVDDMGFSDLGCYGGEIPTPNLDRLAAGGVRFTQFYNTARCSPSRACLLTGLYPHQAGMGFLDNMVLPGSRGYQGRLRDESVTMAEVLQARRLLHRHDRQVAPGPAARHAAVGARLRPQPQLAGRRHLFPEPARQRANAKLLPQRARGRRRIRPNSARTGTAPTCGPSAACGSSTKPRQEKKPFFLYLAHNAPHFPLMAPEEDIARYRGKYKEGWDKLREARYERQIEHGPDRPRSGR